MCTYIFEHAKMMGSVKGQKGWFNVDRANVCYDHPAHAPLDHALLLDFVDDGMRGSDELVPLSHTLTHETMANIVGASRPHTSSVLAELERREVVRRRRRDLLVRPSGLLAVIGHEIDLAQGDSRRSAKAGVA